MMIRIFAQTKAALMLVIGKILACILAKSRLSTMGHLGDLDLPAFCARCRSIIFGWIVSEITLGLTSAIVRVVAALQVDKH